MKSSINVSKENNKDNESAKPNPIIDNINSKYILSKIYDNMTMKKKLKIVKYNKKIQNRLNLDVKDYEEYCKIEIEIIPAKGKYGRFIYINKNDELYYHIYFNDDKEEIKNKYKINKEDGVTKHEYYIDEEDKVTKIKIIIDLLSEANDNDKQKTNNTKNSINNPKIIFILSLFICGTSFAISYFFILSSFSI